MSDYSQRRQQLIDELTPAEREVFDEAYAAAGLAMELAETAYRAREAAGLKEVTADQRLDRRRTRRSEGQSRHYYLQ